MFIISVQHRYFCRHNDRLRSIKTEEDSKKTFTELLSRPISYEDRELVTCYLGAALLCLDEINEAENVLKSCIWDINYQDSFQYKYLMEIDKYYIVKNSLNSYRRIYGDENSKTIEVLQECIRMRKQLKECYNDIHIDMNTIFTSWYY